MKVYLVEEGIDRMGGVERVISTIGNGLSSLYNIKVVSFYKTADSPYFKYNKNIEITYLSKCRFDFFNNIKINVLFKKIYEAIVLKFKIRNYLFKNVKKDDIIICGRIDVALKITQFKLSTENVIVRDAIHYKYYKNDIQKKIKTKLLNKIKMLIVSSDESLNTYKRINCNKTLIIKKIYNPLGIKPIVDYNYNNKIIMSVGRFSSQKGFDNLIDAFSVVREKFPGWKLKIIGSNNDDEYFYNKYGNLESKGIFLVNNTKSIEKELCNASIYVMSSRYEGYANSLVEALACGIPCITYDWLMGANEIVEHNVNGIIVKLCDREAYANGKNFKIDIENLSEAMIELISDEKTCNMMSKNAEKIIQTRDSKLILSEWNKIIIECINGE